MTTIVINKNEICADTQITADSTFNSIKVFKFYSKVFGCEVIAGTAGDCHQGDVFLDWLKTDDELEELDECDALVSDGQSIYFFGGSKYPIPVLDDYMAVGTGAPYALAILDNGGTLSDAVRAAIKRDESSGGEVWSLKLKD